MTQTNNGSFKRKLLATAILAPVMAIVGCSDNDGTTTTPPVVDTPTGTTEGFAYDGYLVGATVCVDENLNKSCDTDEPQTKTGARGVFNLTGLTDAQLLSPLVLQATADTVDEDTGLPVDENLKFLAPAGSTAVSALSTVIQVKVEQAIAAAVAAGTSFSVADLTTEVSNELAADLGVAGTDLTSFDPVAQTTVGTTDGERIKAAKLHLVNKVLSEQIATLIPQATAIADANSLNETSAVSAVIANLDIQAVVTGVNQFTSGVSDPAVIADYTATDANITAPTVELADIQAAADIEATVKEAIEADIQEELNTEPTGATGATGGTGTA
ncbi:hypothetical protein [Marinobacter sp.]|uniref:hypothetical protein n=1 Tax=Marinobacter sp. TaxID=50741 RepID=UPI0019B9B48A|nr:hypothetical protein [Marinobacter sp.]MBD3655366.1 hypothetical protein [Marinobacter sp.]